MRSHQAMQGVMVPAYSADEFIATIDTHCESLVLALCLQRRWAKVGAGIALAEVVSKGVA